METTEIAVFRGRRIRKTLYRSRWWFSVVDVVKVITDCVDPKEYIKKQRKRKPPLADVWRQVVRPLVMDTTSGRQLLNCANSDGISQMIQFIRSPKVKTMTRWLAKASNRQSGKRPKNNIGK